jgi:pyruvate decarboxylase
MIGCCNELNAGYAADGLARESRGLGVVCVTYCVGSLSLINAVAGAYSENLPMLVISGGVNSHDSQARNYIHHTTGEADLYQASKCFAPVTVGTFVIKSMVDAARMIDDAIATAMRLRRPVYLEIACNLATSLLPEPAPRSPINSSFPSDPVSLASAVADAAARLQASTKPVAVVGGKMKECTPVFLELADTLKCALAYMPDAKGARGTPAANHVRASSCHVVAFYHMLVFIGCCGYC